jgi:Tat protein secretion system quality control protein TatD with DNase activity
MVFYTISYAQINKKHGFNVAINYAQIYNKTYASCGNHPKEVLYNIPQNCSAREKQLFFRAKLQLSPTMRARR